ncbi:universal stress protein [Salidesulfovibrio onnuriiensis]|uniref:universal stress protein n=1 Tax=Salidesulfovibrio onnuriiensis TaxID=2583823 RepID=UPI0011C8C331|nr:universal stress protein [Salidesulfovibrio onnuriiensis]
MFKKILLATHGTPGAQKAERLAAQWAAQSGAELVVLSIFNEDWQHMTGDDWLNASATRNRFADYVMGEVNAEMDRLVERLDKNLAGLRPRYRRASGDIAAVLAETAEEEKADVVIMGAYQKKQAPGFKARFENKRLHPMLPCPLVVAP